MGHRPHVKVIATLACTTCTVFHGRKKPKKTKSKATSQRERKRHTNDQDAKREELISVGQENSYTPQDCLFLPPPFDLVAYVSHSSTDKLLPQSGAPAESTRIKENVHTHANDSLIRRRDLRHIPCFRAIRRDSRGHGLCRYLFAPTGLCQHRRQTHPGQNLAASDVPTLSLLQNHLL